MAGALPTVYGVIGDVVAYACLAWLLALLALPRFRRRAGQDGVPDSPGPPGGAP